MDPAKIEELKSKYNELIETFKQTQADDEKAEPVTIANDASEVKATNISTELKTVAGKAAT